MKNDSIQGIIEFLNRTNFKKTEIDNMGEALSTIIFHNPINQIKISYAIKTMGYLLLSKELVYKQKGNRNIVVCFTPSYSDRKDYIKDIERVLSTIDGYVAFISNEGKKFSLKTICRVPIIFSWLKKMKGMKVTLAYKIYLCAFIFAAYNYRFQVIERLKKEKIKPKLAVTFCDVHVCDYFITEYFNKCKIPTASLQHAVFDHVNNWYANRFSRSNHFLGISEFGKKEYVKSGGDSKKYIVIGSMKYIGQKMNEGLIFPDSGIIGIALSGVAFENENKALLELAGRIIEDFNYRFIIRIHPALSRSVYEDIIDKKYMSIDESPTLEEFASKCDLCIMGSTNTFGELISNGHIALRMVFDADVFDGIDNFRFTNYEELKLIVEDINKDFSVIETAFSCVRSELCASGEIEKNYKSFFEEYTK